MIFKTVMTYEPPVKKVRLFRLRWGTHPNDPGSTHMISVALQPALLRCSKEYNGWRLTVCGVNVHFQSHTRGVCV